MRCPTHGHVEDEEATTCPVGLVRTITGVATAEPCGMPLEPEYPADETDVG